jgi:hypothetical protein
VDNIKLDLKNKGMRMWSVFPGSGYCLFAGSCEHCNELWAS